MKCWFYKLKKTGKSGMINKTIYVLYFIIALILISCQNESYGPKPRGYHRIEFPQKSYHRIDNGCPFVFEIPDYSKLINDSSENTQPCWKNLDFSKFNARLHLSYFQIDNKNITLHQLTQDAWSFAFKHTSKATAIDQSVIHNPVKNIYGIEYKIRGNTASNIQFYLTDSVEHYIRGALYFNEKPNLDSIQPVLKYISDDLDHLINTFAWK